MVQFKRWLGVICVVIVALLGIQTAYAGDCADGNTDACWARFYTANGPMGEEGRVYFRIYKACQDGIRIGIATNIQENYTFYIKQFGNGEAPPFRLLTQQTDVTLNDYPEGVEIEYTDEAATDYAGTTTVYFVRVFNVGWSEVFDSDYMDNIMIASPDYGYSEDGPDGIVRSAEFDTCYTYNAPFDTLVAPFVQCVTRERDGRLTAVFGYYSRIRVDSIIPDGPYNSLKRLFGGLLKADVPTVFEPGIHYNAFRFSAATPGLIWQVAGRRAAASILSPRCR